ncbi:hypothetical protein BLA27_06875 [Brucella cytisi]|uniref:Uncharacterized protein n=1 Tax=Brucella cytisi TaxID=407152 RepID=A0A1J6HPB5_9HYPH|nr:hypothetical protein BLA27_06875 [Brucella cytisi]
MFKSFQRLDEAPAEPKHPVHEGEAGSGKSLDQIVRFTSRHPANEIPARRETIWVSFSIMPLSSVMGLAKSSCLNGFTVSLGKSVTRSALNYLPARDHDE